MKNLKNGTCCLLFMLCCFYSVAQKNQLHFPLNEPNYNKPRLFADLPEHIDLNVAHLTPVLNAPVGANVTIRAVGKYPLIGTVVSKADYGFSKSVVVRLINRIGATLTLTRINNDDNTFSYLGRIISLKHGDAYDLVQDAGRFVFQRSDVHRLISE